MARMTAGTAYTIDSAYLAADRALIAVQELFTSNPDLSPRMALADPATAPIMKARNTTWRAATGSINTITTCPCGIVNPHVTDALRTVCCNASTVVVR